MTAPFAPSLLVEIRRRMGESMFETFHGVIIDAVEEAKVKSKSNKQTRSVQKPDDHDDDPPPVSDTTDKEPASPNQGKLILDATVAPQAIRYPTDLNLLNEAREFRWIIRLLINLHIHPNQQ